VSRKKYKSGETLILYTENSVMIFMLQLERYENNVID